MNVNFCKFRGTVPKYRRNIPFNREIVRLVQKWEILNKVKFHGKILGINIADAQKYGQSDSFTNFKNIYLMDSTKFVLLHELNHILHQKYGYNLIRACLIFHRENFNPFYREDDYYLMPHERFANRNAKKQIKKIK